MKVEKTKDCSIATEFLSGCFSAPTHWPDWNLLVSKAFNTNFFYLIASEEGRIIGLCPVHETRYKKQLRKRQSGQVHFIPFGGWIFNQPTPVERVHFDLRNQTSFEGFSLPLLEAFNCQYGNLKTNAKATLIIQLEASEEEIWKNSLESKRRNMVRKAEKKGVTVRRATTAQDMEAFYQLYAEASRRNDLNLLSRDFFTGLAQDCPNISMDILGAYKEDNQLANVVVISDKDYALYWLGNNAAGNKNDGQGELLQWEAIKLAKSKGCRYYDLCYIEPKSLPNIYRFKKGFSKNEVPLKHFTLRPLLFRVLNKALKQITAS